MSHRRLPFPLFAAPLLVLGLLAVWAAPAASDEPDAVKQKEISDLEKQLEALTRKLKDLRGDNGEAAPAPMPETASATLPSDWVKSFHWRCIGPATMGGRITALSVFEQDPTTYWVATASGGLLKTTNNGNTFEHQFDREATVSIGDVCVAPSDRNIVWVGTGENNPRNSVSYGDGVYKSTDGGKTWKNMGLKKSFQIGRIIVHPRDPNIVYVGALGRLYGPSEERGLYKTTDGGKTWDRILHVDDKSGVIDMVMHPIDPETLLVATWERKRDEFDSWPGNVPKADGYDGYDPIRKWGPGSRLHKTTDGGKTFRRITAGLPTVPLGRMGLDWYRKDPKVAYLIVDSERIGTGPPGSAGGDGYMGIVGEDADAGARLTQITPDGPADKAGVKAGDIVVSVEGKPILSYRNLVEVLQARGAGEKLKLKIARNREGVDIVVTLGKRPGPQQGNPKRPFGRYYGGQAENIQDKQGKEGFQCGGVYKSTDSGESWTRVNSLNPRPMYFSTIRVDPSDEKFVYVLGVALHLSSDGGKTFKADDSRQFHADQHALWIDPRDGRHLIIGTDGGHYASCDRGKNWDHHNDMALGQFYHVAVDNRRPYRVYGGLQDNGSWGGPSMSLAGPGILNEDWILVGGGDGFVCRVDPSEPDLIYYESQDGNMLRRNLKTGQFGAIRPRQERGATPYRFNWNTPFLLSAHNPRIYYCAGNFVFRSVKQGDELRVISPEITRTKRGSGTALAESPLSSDVLWAGTDDGHLWVTRDGGAKWSNVMDKVGLPGPRWVSTIEASRFEQGRAYVVFDGHRSDDDEPYVYVTEDYGQTWKSLRANLPGGSTRTLREDVRNPNLLYLGTEFAAWASLDRGKHWTKINNNLPTVAVHEFAVHPTAGELVAATHGRSVWVLDVAPLRQMTAEALQAKAQLYEPAPAVRWRSEPSRGSPFGGGARRFLGENPARGAQLYYSLASKADKVSLKIVDPVGKTLRELPAKGDPGLHRVSWDLQRAVPRQEAQQPAGRPGGPRGGPGVALAPVPPGTYRVVLTVNDQEFARALRIEGDPTLPANALVTEEEPSVAPVIDD